MCECIINRQEIEQNSRSLGHCGGCREKGAVRVPKSTIFRSFKASSTGPKPSKKSASRGCPLSVLCSAAKCSPVVFVIAKSLSEKASQFVHGQARVCCWALSVS